MNKISCMQTEYKSTPLGMDEIKPRFFYKIEGAPASQVQCRIKLRNAAGTLLWDTWWMETSETIQIEYQGNPLAPFTRYFWQVESLLDTGETLVSDETYFETGFLGSSWNAQWIGCYGGSANMRPVQHLSRTFTVDDTSETRLAITALGLYQAEINGQKVTSDLFTPGWTDYYQRVQYQVYDVSGLLRKGENEITVYNVCRVVALSGAKKHVAV